MIMIEKSKRASKRAETTAFVGNLKTGPCADCKNRFPPECMDFDHVRAPKLGRISWFMHRVCMEELLDEIAKCELVCSNCHRIRTRKQRTGAKLKQPLGTIMGTVKATRKRAA